MTAPAEHRIRVSRSARWYSLGEATPAVREIWLVVHGYGQLARDFAASFAPIAAPERLVAAPEALSRFYAAGGDRNAHARAPVGASWMTREDRDAEILDYVDYLDAVVERAAAAVTDARLVALGFSQGTATVSRWAMHGTRRPDRLILWGGAPADEITPEQLRERLGDAPLELVHGRADSVVPFARASDAAERLRAAGVPVRLHAHDGGHRIQAGVLAELAS